MAKLIDLQVLDNFKLRQDAANDAYFIKRSNIVKTGNNVKIIAKEAASGSTEVSYEALTVNSNIDPAKVKSVNGSVLPLDVIPAAAQERMVVVNSENARLALTKTSNPAVQNGDVVHVFNASSNLDKMYFVVDDTKLGTSNKAQAFQEFRAGYASTVPWAGVQNKPSSKGNANTPVYINSNGEPTACSKVVNVIKFNSTTEGLFTTITTNGTEVIGTTAVYPSPIPSGGTVNQFLMCRNTGTSTTGTNNRSAKWHSIVIPTSQPSDMVAGSIWIEP